MDSVISRRLPGDYEIAWKLDTKEKIDEWITTVDGDNNEGYSRAQFELGKNNTGIFHGYLDTRVSKDGKTYYAGYANISSPELLVSTKLQDGGDGGLTGLIKTDGLWIGNYFHNHQSVNLLSLADPRSRGRGARCLRVQFLADLNGVWISPIGSSVLTHILPYFDQIEGRTYLEMFQIIGEW